MVSKNMGVSARVPQWEIFTDLLPGYDRVQELALSRVAIIAIGKYSFPWKSFESFVQWLPSHRLDPAIYPQLAEQVTRVVKASCHRHFSSQFFRYVHLSASDPRDKIFGILGISSFSGTRVIPDYTKSTEEVLLDAAVAMIRDRKLALYYLMPLQPARVSGSLDRASSLPSWVPDLLCARDPYTTGKYALSGRKDTYYLPDYILEYNLSDSVLDRMCSQLLFPPATFSPDLRMLHAPGILIGTIVETSGEPLNHLDGAMRNLELPENIQRLYDSVLGPRGIALGSMLQLFTRVRDRSGETPVYQAVIDSFDPDVRRADTPRGLQKRMQGIVDGLIEELSNRVLFVTDNNHIGLAYHPDATGGIRSGDIVAGLFGINFPFILRPTGDGHYQMVNLARMHEVEWGHDFLGNKPLFNARPPNAEETQRENRKGHRKDASDISWRDYEHHGMREFVII
jgi:hypothetical protein